MDSTKQAIRQILSDSDSKVISDKEFLLRLYGVFSSKLRETYEFTHINDAFDYASYVITSIISTNGHTLLVKYAK